MKSARLIPTLLLLIITIAASADDKVAKIGEQYFSTLKEAVDSAADGDVIQMVADYTTGESISINTKAITLDLNGKTINYTTDKSGGKIAVQENGSLTITDSNTEKEGGIAYSTTGAAGITLIAVEGTCTIEKGNLSFAQTESADGCRLVSVAKNGKLTINGGNISTVSGNNGAINNNGGDIIINGGAITNSCTAKLEGNPAITYAATIVNNIHGSLTITGGNIKSNQYAIWVISGAVTLSPAAKYTGKIGRSDNENDITLALTDEVELKDVDENLLHSTTTISYKRAKTENTWGTVCLPFAPDNSEKKITYFAINKIDAAAKTIDVTEVAEPLANTPYLFMLNSDADGIFEAHAAIAGSNTAINTSEPAKDVIADGCTLKGVYKTTAVFASQEDLNKYSGNAPYDNVCDPAAYYISGNSICPINSYFYLKPYRAYIAATGQAQSKGAHNYQVAILDEITGINETASTDSNKKITCIYNLAGQKRNSLQAGVNIVRYSDGTCRTINIIR